MKNNSLTLLFLFFVCFSFAQTKDSLSVEEQARREKNIQAGNPFKKFGYTPKIATLSKGKYLEFHDLDSIVKIGSFSYHVKEKTITGYKRVESQNSEATLSPEVISRWLSPDPLAEEFPSWSPYNFTMNNPIIYIDPTGMAPEDWFKNQEGRIVWFDNTSESFTSENGNQWQNVGSNLKEVADNLNLPNNTNAEWTDLEFVTLGGASGDGKGAFGATVLESSAQVSFDLNVENGGANGLELIDGQTEITGVNINMTLSTETSAPGVQLMGIGGSFGIKQWNATGNNNINSSSSFAPVEMLSGSASHASGRATLTLGLSSFSNQTKRIDRGGTLNLGVNSTATFNLQQTGRKGVFSTFNTIKIR